MQKMGNPRFAQTKISPLFLKGDIFLQFRKLPISPFFKTGYKVTLLNFSAGYKIGMVSIEGYF
jgi:hypothetical protein